MNTIELIRLNLFSPMVLAFVLGIIATRIRSDLKIPEALYTSLSIYLLLAIGVKGGAELSATPLNVFWGPAAATIFLGCSIPLWSYAILRRFGRFSVADAAAIAAHYGSVSVVTFSAGQTFLENLRLPFEGFMPTLVALLEIPAIVIALLIARMRSGQSGSWGRLMHELLTGRSILLLGGGLLIGLFSGKEGLNAVAPLFVDPFKGVLTIFLLEMGMVAAQRFDDLRKAGTFLIGFGIIMPIIHGMLGVSLGAFSGLSLAGSMLLGVMAASASYIAAPAAVRIALPQANPGYYLTAALAITFPFNLVIGIPLYYAFAEWIFVRG